MLSLRENLEGSISNPIDGVKNSSTNQEIEIIEVNSYKNELVKVKILKDPHKYFNPDIKNLYSENKDIYGINIINKIEKYPTLPDDIFIQAFSPELNIKELDNYMVNKMGIILNIKKKKLTKRREDRVSKGYPATQIGKRTYKIHRLVAFTFLINPDLKVYSVVNHIDHNITNYYLSNLNFLTIAENNNQENNTHLKSTLVDESKLTSYVAINNDGVECFCVNSRNNNYCEEIYNIASIRTAISKKETYKGYTWISKQSSQKLSKEYYFKLIGYSGNLDDYKWEKHSVYPELFVCKEGFIKRNNRLIYGCFNKDGYIVVHLRTIDTSSDFVHRIILEHILKRKLNNKELVDHINTVRYDNSFDNLKLSNSKENSNNPITLKNRSSKFIVSDLFGNFIMYDTARNIKQYVNSLYDNEELTISLAKRKTVFLKGEFIVFKNIKEITENLIIDCLKRVNYVFNDRNELIDAIKIKHLKNTVKEKYNVTVSELYRSEQKNIKTKSGFYFKRGENIVKELILPKSNLLNKIKEIINDLQNPEILNSDNEKLTNKK